MTVFSMMGASRFVAVFVDGPVIVWEFAGSEHLATDVTTVDEVRTAPRVTALGGSRDRAAIDDFAAEIAALCAEHLRAGPTEIEVWSHFHQRLIATDAIAYGGYGVDFSRCYSVGAESTADQRSLHAKAREQLEHNAELLGPGMSFSEFARSAWVVPARHAPWGYYCLAHGLGLCGEYPYVPLARAGDTYDFGGEFEPGMVICIESYIGDETLHQGVKLEDEYLITDKGTERLTTAPFDPTL